MPVSHQPPLPLAPPYPVRGREKQRSRATLGPFFVPCIPGDVSFLRCRRPRPSAEYMMQEMHHRHPRSTTYRHDNLRISFFSLRSPACSPRRMIGPFIRPPWNYAPSGCGYACIPSWPSDQRLLYSREKKKKKPPQPAKSFSNIT
jgi:hypothetical protein